MPQHLNSVDFKHLPRLKSVYLLHCIYLTKQSFCIMYYLQRKKKKMQLHTTDGLVSGLPCNLARHCSFFNKLVSWHGTVTLCPWQRYLSPPSDIANPSVGAAGVLSCQKVFRNARWLLVVRFDLQTSVLVWARSFEMAHGFPALCDTCSSACMEPPRVTYCLVSMPISDVLIIFWCLLWMRNFNPYLLLPRREE